MTAGIPDKGLPTWVLVLGFLSGIALVLFLLFANLFGPCSWLLWQPVSDVPARCLRGLAK